MRNASGGHPGGNGNGDDDEDDDEDDDDENDVDFEAVILNMRLSGTCASVSSCSNMTLKRAPLVNGLRRIVALYSLLSLHLTMMLEPIPTLSKTTGSSCNGAVDNNEDEDEDEDEEDEAEASEDRCFFFVVRVLLGATDLETRMISLSGSSC